MTNFQAMTSISGDVKATSQVGLRVTAEHRLIRYRGRAIDPPGISTPPRLDFLSHDYFLNSTNWGVRVGPVFRF